MKIHVSTLLAALLAAPLSTVARDDSPPYYRTVEIWATADGFLPSSVKVKQGQKVRLMVRRTTEESAPRDFALDEFLVWLVLRPGASADERVAWGTVGTERVALSNVATELFAATRAGEFTFHTRDGKHSGRLIVEPTDR
jgi:hypothetical protein